MKAHHLLLGIVLFAVILPAVYAQEEDVTRVVAIVND